MLSGGLNKMAGSRGSAAVIWCSKACRFSSTSCTKGLPQLVPARRSCLLQHAPQGLASRSKHATQQHTPPMCADVAVCGRRAQELLEAARQRDPRTAGFPPFPSHSSAASHRSQLAPLPSMPELPEIPAMPQRPRREDLPAMLERPRLEDLPQLPDQPQMPAPPKMPGKPKQGDLPQLPELPEMPRQGDLPQLPELPERPRQGDLPEMPPVPAMPHSPAPPQAPVPALHAPPRPRSQAGPEAHARASTRSPLTAALSPTGSRYLHSPATPDRCEGAGAFPPWPEFTPFPALPDMPPFSDSHRKALSTARPAAVAPPLLSAGSPTDAEVLSCGRCAASCLLQQSILCTRPGMAMLAVACAQEADARSCQC